MTMAGCPTTKPNIVLCCSLHIINLRIKPIYILMCHSWNTKTSIWQERLSMRTWTQRWSTDTRHKHIYTKVKAKYVFKPYTQTHERKHIQYLNPIHKLMDANTKAIRFNIFKPYTQTHGRKHGSKHIQYLNPIHKHKREDIHILHIDLYTWIQT